MFQPLPAVRARSARHPPAIPAHVARRIDGRTHYQFLVSVTMMETPGQMNMAICRDLVPKSLV